MCPKMINVIADDREATRGVVDAFLEMDDVSVSVKRLSVGDYEVDNSLLFERKTLVDFVASIKDGRLFYQAYKLLYAPFQTVVILEGISSDLSSSGMRREAIQGAIVSLGIQYGIPILRSKNAGESAGLMIYAAKQIRRDGRQTGFRYGKKPKVRRKRQLYILQGLPGVGPKKAGQLLECFGSVREIVTASHDELVSVRGIGNYTAKAIYDIVKEGRVCYRINMC